MDIEAVSALWREIVGDDLFIPAVNSDVVYLPALHLQQSTDVVHPQLLETIAARVKSVSMGFVAGTGYPMLNFVLVPEREEEEEGGHNNEELVEGMQRQGFLFYHEEISFGDIGGPCQLKKFESSKFFPNNPPKVFFVFADGSEHAFPFNNGKLTGADWNLFIQEKRMVLGDSLVLMKRRQAAGDAVFLGMIRSTPIEFSGHSVLEAVQLAEQGSEFRVCFFPHGGRPPVVIHD